VTVEQLEQGLEQDAPIPADRLGRPVRDLRISVTDRCNFRCRYCMPREVYGASWQFLPREEILDFAEIARLARIFSGLGIRKLRLTGGEPLLRHRLPDLIRLLRDVDGMDIALTTNGSLLAAQAPALVEAGLRRITVSLDSLDDAVFRAMNDADFGVECVLEGIATAAAVGLPVKINAVIRRGLNEHTVQDLASWAREHGHIVRFIEYMDVGHTNGWRLDDVVPGAEIVRRIGASMPLEPTSPNYAGEVAQRWRYVDGGGEVGVITSVTQPFCGACTRARLSADGQLYTCLFATRGTDLRAMVRNGHSDDDISGIIRNVWAAREDRYSEQRSASTVDLPKVEMSYIGG
jgi:cyclic pyranopterin phosphate synthase